MSPGRLGARAVVLLLGAWSLLPLVNWIVNERSAPWYPAAIRTWGIATLGIGLLATLLAFLSRKVPALWREGSISGALASLDPATTGAAPVVAGFALLVYAAIAWFIFGGKPLHIDEVVQLIQARMMAAGQLSIPADPDPAFRSILHLVDHGGRWFGHFPPGWPALLAVGEVLRVPWIVTPIVGAVSVLAWAAVLRRIEVPASVRGGALLGFALAPFTAFMAGSYMNHPAALMWCLIGVACFLTARERRRIRPAIFAGLAFGLAAITRPADAVAFVVPAGIWLAAELRITRDFRVPVALGIGILVPLGLLGFVNAATTGSALVSGYQLLWGGNVGLGFHSVPWGPPHTPLRGVELVNLYLLRLNAGWLEALVPGLLFPLAAGFFTPRWSAVERYLLAAGGLLLGLYFAYWHDGYYLGPRFMYPLAPILALGLARLPRAVLDDTGSETGRRIAAYAVGLALLTTLANGLPTRAAVYAASQPTMRFDADRAADEAKIPAAVVFVQESWGAELLARLWAMGVSKPDAERFYHGIDACLLEQLLTTLEGEGAEGIAAARRLDRATADSARLVASPFSPDTSERVLNGANYSPLCVSRINEDRAGFTLYAPLWLARRPDLLFVRNLHERNRELVTRFPDRALYRLTQGKDDAVPRFVPLRRDSVLAP